MRLTCRDREPMEGASRGRVVTLCLAALFACSATGALETPDQRMRNPWFREGREAVKRAQQRAGAPASGRARNVILFVGDGMSIPTVTAARILEGQLRGETGEENLLAFERLPYTALSKTYNTDMQVPDSAGTMTAMISGVKTRIGVLGVDDRVVRGDHRISKAAARGSAKTAASSDTPSGTACRLATGTPICSAKAPSASRMPITRRSGQCRGRPERQVAHSRHAKLISHTTRLPRQSRGPASTVPTSSWPSTPRKPM